MVTEVTTMKVVTVRDFRDHASEMFHSTDVILVTRDGIPAGFFVPWTTPELPPDLQRELFGQITGRLRRERELSGVTEEEVLADFAASRGDRRRR
jgi:hypothetical protein